MLKSKRLRPKRMTATQFDRALNAIKKTDEQGRGNGMDPESKGCRGARLHIVDGLSQTDAGWKVQTPRQVVQKAAALLRGAHRKIMRGPEAGA